eukprot:358262-Chlamydomonas_euryale.AAC.12
MCVAWPAVCQATSHQSWSVTGLPSAARDLADKNLAASQLVRHAAYNDSRLAEARGNLRTRLSAAVSSMSCCAACAQNHPAGPFSSTMRTARIQA